MIDLSNSIALLATGTYPLTRGSAGSFVGGDYVPGATVAMTIEAVIVPASGRQLERLPEGQRTKDVIAIYSPTELRTASVAGAPADQVEWSGAQYQVQSVKAWNEAGGFFEALAVRSGQ